MAAVSAVPAVGYVFDEATGRLYEHAGRSVTMMLPWPGLLAFTRVGDDDNWNACLPDAPLLALRREQAGGKPPAVFDIVMRDTAVRRAASDAVQGFCDRIPRDVLGLVAPFADRHWHLLRWLNRAGPAAEDLCASNPALAYMVASSWEFGSDRERRAQQAAPVMLAYRKQREILGRLGFPAREALRHITRKIAPSGITIPRVLALQGAVSRPEVSKKLCHVQRIGPDVLQIAGGLAIRHVTPSVLEEISRLPDDPSADLARTLGDTLRMWRRVRRREHPPLFQSVRRIHEVHDTLVHEVNRLGLGSVCSDVPNVPVAGTATIIPITSREMLLEEGRSQHNCVASYAGRVEKRQVAIYRVLEPERATLSLARRGDRWRIDQLKGPCNRPVHGKTRAAVRAWLDTEGVMDPDLQCGDARP